MTTLAEDYMVNYTKFKELLDSYMTTNKNHKALHARGVAVIAQLNVLTEGNDPKKLHSMDEDHLSQLNKILIFSTQATNDLQNGNKNDVIKSCNELRTISNQLPVKRSSEWKVLAGVLLGFVGALMIVAGIVAGGYFFTADPKKGEVSRATHEFAKVG